MDLKQNELNQVKSTVTSAIQTNNEKGKQKETATQRKQRLAKEKKKRQEKLANETEEEKRLRLEKRKMRIKNESKEQRESRLNSYHERYIKARSEETQLQREKRLLADREWHAQSRLNESMEQREKRLTVLRQNRSRAIANETQEQREKRLLADRQRHALQTQGKTDNRKRKETTTQRKRRLEKARQYAKRKYEEKRANDDQKNIETISKQRTTQKQNDSIEKCNQKLQQIKQLNSQIISMMTSSKRCQRLVQMSQHDSEVRATPKHSQRLQTSQQNSQIGSKKALSQHRHRLYQMRQNISQLLNEPDLMYSPLDEPSPSLQYSLADLQRAMGASDGEMAMLKQIGEIKVEEHSGNDDWSTMNALELCRTTLDEESVCGNSLSMSNSTTVPVSNVGTSMNDSSISTSSLQSTTTANLQLAIDDEDLSLLPDSKTSEVESNELLADHTGKEVICPTCFCRFMGFPALQLHISKSHPATPNSNECSALVSTLSKRALLEITEENRLVCFKCRQILPANLMPSHLVEHSSEPIDIAKCQPIGDPVRNDNNDEGEKFKYEMSDALGDLLDRAANNLITAKQDSSNGMSDIAVQLLNNLCALKKKSAPHQRFHPSAKEMLLKVFDKYCFEAEQKNGASNGLKVGNFTCRICGESFLWESKATWRKHVLETHARPCAMPNLDDLSSDHDEAVDAEGELHEDDLKSRLPLSDDKIEQPLITTDKPTASTETKDPSTVSTNNSSNSYNQGLRKGSDNSSASTSEITPSPSGNQSSQSSINGPQNKRLRDNQKRRGALPNSCKRKRLIRIKEDKTAKKRAEEALRELNLSQKVETAHMISSGQPVRFRFGIDKI